MLSNAGPSKALEIALSESMNAGNFIDTKFYVFSRRASAELGRVDTPRALYANSRVLKASSDYFRSLFSDQFFDGFDMSPASGFPADQDQYKDDYDYYSDSDLDESEDTAIDTEASEASEIQATCEIKPTEPPPQPKTNDAPDSSSPQALRREISGRQYLGRNPTLKTFIIKHTAFTTFYAILWYMYTTKIQFSPLGSHRTGNVPRPSAKSVYRFADEVRGRFRIIFPC
jgi:hypothetical protein